MENDPPENAQADGEQLCEFKQGQINVLEAGQKEAVVLARHTVSPERVRFCFEGACEEELQSVLAARAQSPLLIEWCCAANSSLCAEAENVVLGRSVLMGAVSSEMSPISWESPTRTVWSKMQSRSRLTKACWHRRRTYQNFSHGELVYAWRRAGPVNRGQWRGPGVVVMATTNGCWVNMRGS